MEFGFGERKKRVKLQSPKFGTVGSSFGSSLQPNSTGNLFGSSLQQSSSGGTFCNFSQQSSSGGTFSNFSQPSSSASSFGQGPSWPHTTITSTLTEELESPYSDIAVQGSGRSYGDQVLSSLRHLKDEDIVCDFIINVGNESFMVHRAVLVACSEYFRAMFKHDTKERQESAVYMKDVEAEAVKKCIDYMYSGNANITVNTAGDILHAASLMQLEELRESCFKTIEQNVNSENCLDIADILGIYSCEHLQRKVELCIGNNFYDVIKTEKFALKSLDDLLSFVSNSAKTDESSWKALKLWIDYNESERSENIDELMKLIKLVHYPSANLLQSIANDSLIKNSPKRLDRFIQRIFSSTTELEKNLSMDNFFIVRQFQKRLKLITKEAQNIIDEFLIEHFEQILIQDEFVYLTEKEVLMILGAQNVQCLASEELRWHAIIKWLEYDSDRMHLAPEMMKNVDFSQLPKQFIHDTVRQEPLVKDSPGCMTILMDGLLNTKLNYKTQTECIAVLSKDCMIHAFHLNENKSSLEIPTIPTGTGSKIFSFNEKLCLFNTTGIYYLGTNNKWIKKTAVRGVPPHSKVVVLKNRICLISEGATCSYDTLNDSWNMELPLPDLSGDVASFDNRIYAFCSKGVKVLDENRSWEWVISEVEIASPTTSIYPFMDHIYAFQPESAGLRRWDVHGSQMEQVSNIPGPKPDEACLFVADEKIVVLSKTSFTKTLYAYDVVYKQWMKIKELPQSIPDKVKQATTHTVFDVPIKMCGVLSACSFKLT